ncbi:MAG: hypothetical protein LIO75_07795 [Lachnospiraceae bacterium]|nr:hypothetical protein [Lachnospiraceae bacterium]
MTGILPIKKYGTESALTDFHEFTMAAPDTLAPYVGFTEQEVADAFGDATDQEDWGEIAKLN